MNSAEVRNLQVLAPLSYILKDKLQVQMTGLLHVDVSTPNGAAQVIIDGDLTLHQDSPMPYETGKQLVHLQNPIALDLVSKSSLQDLIE